MDFISDSLYSGRSFRMFTVIDDFNFKHSLLKLIPAYCQNVCIIRVPDRIAAYHGYSKVIRQGNRSEFISLKLEFLGEKRSFYRNLLHHLAEFIQF